MTSILFQPVAQIMSTEILSAPPDMPVHEAALLMSERRCSSILVVDATGRAIGIWTEADALKSELHESGAHPLLLRETMSSPVLTLTVETTIRDAVVMFHDKMIRHALVVDASGHRGMLSMSDIIRHQGGESFLGLRRLETLEIPSPCLLDSSETLQLAIEQMRSQAVDAVVVRLSAVTFGILTQRDVVRLVAQGQQQVSLGEVCTRALLSVSARTTMTDARRLLMVHQIRHLGVLDAEGELIGLIGFADILHSIEQGFLLELHQMLYERDQALSESQRSLMLAEKVFESTMEGIIITDGAGLIQSVNSAFTRITGYSSQDVVGKSPSLLNSGKQPAAYGDLFWQSLKRDNCWHGETINRHKSGQLYTAHMSVTGVRNEGEDCHHYVAVFSDITQSKQTEARLQFLADHDVLTGLANRTLFTARLHSLLEHAAETDQRLALLYVDLDRFKLLNDTFGHQAGDELLTRVADNLSRILPEGSLIARLAGDEFVALLTDVESVQQVACRAQDLLSTLSGETVVAQHHVFVSASIGISMYPEDGRSADSLLANADAAMCRAKECGKNTFQFYAGDMNARALERLRLESGLHRALNQQELELWYQPKVDLKTGRLSGAEALIRWRHPELGLIAPDTFIPIAEDSSLIVQIGEWVLATACQDMRRWRDQNLFDGRIAVNISGRQFKFGSIVQTVRDALQTYDLPSTCLELEVTESVAMEEGAGMTDVLLQLQQLGVYLSIDDFGTGYSSLSYLKRLPVNGIKIDRSFIMDLHHDSDDVAITKAIISIAHSLGLDLVAEGVERSDQRDFLLQQGCVTGQGYFYSRPLPAEEFEQLLQSENWVMQGVIPQTRHGRGAAPMML
jgi:diguanylate cyclase (GGDEF)-like protein/PAS domain S-box-containing protein